MIRGVIWMILSRLWHNRRLAATTVLGFVLAVAIVCSIPIFADGALQRILGTELGKTEQPGTQPAALTFSYFGKDGATSGPPRAAYEGLHKYMTGPALRELPFTPNPFIHIASLDASLAAPADPTRMDPGKPLWLKGAGISDLPGRSRVIDGRMFKPGKQDADAIEVVITDAATMEHELTVGAELLVPVARGNQFAKTVKVRIVGVIADPKPGDDLYLLGGQFDSSLLMDMETFWSQVLTVEGAIPYQFTYYLGLNASDISLANLETYLSGMYNVEARAAQLLPGTSLFASPRAQLNQFAHKAQVLRQMLLILSVPLLALVGYYLIVTASLTVDRQRQEIAVLRSRGAGMGQILGVYTVEGLIYAGIAMLSGPFLGLLIAKAMGAAAGFVQFVDRKPLPATITPRALEYGAAAALLALLATLIPAAMAARESIVTFKQQQARAGRRPFYHRFFLDILLVLLSLYGWYTLNGKLAALAKAPPPKSPAEPAEMLVDPLHFLLPALLIAGLGLVLLRLLPLIAAGLERLTRRRAGAPLHLALTQVARSPNGTAPVILLLTLTVGLGLYSAAAARTLEAGYADRIHFQQGAEVVLTEVWESDEQSNTFYEPPWSFHTQMPGVASAARVRVSEKVSVAAGGKNAGTGTLMAIVPPEFGNTAWFRRDLSPYHINEYLNLLASDEEAVLITPAFMAKYRLQSGDRITLSADGRDVSLVVYGAVPYWPGVNTRAADVFVANLEYIQEHLGLRPYQTWLRMEEGASTGPVVQRVAAEKIPLLQIEDARATTANARRDPQRTGLYGALTISFIVSAALTVLGFLLYALLSLRSRLLQLGVLRAMGLSVSQLLGALGLEQVYTVGVGMLSGTGFGLLAARLYLPALQMSSDMADHLLPFRIVTDPVDRIRLYAILGAMLLAGFGSLALVLRSLQIHQAVKLGEDA